VGSIEATRMAVEDFGSKAAGKPIEIIHADHQNKTDIGAAVARRWIDVDGVDAIVDVPNSAIALAVQEIAKEKNRVLLVSTAAPRRAKKRSSISQAKRARRSACIGPGTAREDMSRQEKG
jgi:branched-chain amino acid transport system substrate-binding protein